MLVSVNNWCLSNYININVQKTKYCIYGSRCKLGDDTDTNLTFGNQQILKCHHYNYLGVNLDECLNMNSNYNKIFKKYSHKIYQFGKIRKYITQETRILVYKQTILPLIEYVSFMLLFNRSCGMTNCKDYRIDAYVYVLTSIILETSQYNVCMKGAKLVICPRDGTLTCLN